MCCFATYQNLVEEVLDKLLLQWSRRQQAMEIGSQEFGNEVTTECQGEWSCARRGGLHVLQRGDEDIA